MDVQVVEAFLEQKPALHRLMQLYLYDSTECTGDDAVRTGYSRIAISMSIGVSLTDSRS